ncbi:MAG: hypothetical protein [Caudoviricetes sp.]|nr:MAG: hypothetical protein [Caudoviricetes sp.]
MDFQAIEEAIKNSSPESGVYVGCDSKKNGSQLVYVSTVVIHYDKNKGGIVFKDVEIVPYLSFYSKLQGEIYRVANLGLKIKELCDGRHFEVHVDINPNECYKSHAAYQEAKGAVLGIVGVMPKFKPDAWAASSAADRDAVLVAGKISRRRRRKKR